MLNKILQSNERFSDVNTVRVNRSQFSMPYNNKTTFNAGYVIPFFAKEVLPGDTWDTNIASVVRMSTPLYPVMDNAQFETAFFFVPMRLTWDRTKEFFGENKDGAWVSHPAGWTEPIIPNANVMVKSGTALDYMGLPVTRSTDYQENVGFIQSSYINVSNLPLRAYRLIWNRWFRNQNLQPPVNVNTGSDGNVDWSNPGSFGFDALLPVGKLNDYFTTALPAPQKGNSVTLPLSESDIPVVTKSTLNTDKLTGEPIRVVRNGELDGDDQIRYAAIGFNKLGSSFNNFAPGDYTADVENLEFNNLFALGSEIDAYTINTLRTAFQIQRILERDARTGTRYVEYLRAAFGVVSPDARLQDPEYLGGSRQMINMQQVLQTGATQVDVSPQGNASGFSKTVDGGHVFTRTFTEHGFIIGCCWVRTLHTYQQGIDKMWLRRERYDVYDPALAHIGEQPIYVNQIYNGKNQSEANSYKSRVFGYQEAWADYRNLPSHVTGKMRSGIKGSFDVWHYGDFYADLPVLSADWWKETDANVARTLAVQDTALSHQFIADILVDNKVSRAMPVRSTPGLIDHF